VHGGRLAVKWPERRARRWRVGNARPLIRLGDTAIPGGRTHPEVCPATHLPMSSTLSMMPFACGPAPYWLGLRCDIMFLVPRGPQTLSGTLRPGVSHPVNHRSGNPTRGIRLRDTSAGAWRTRRARPATSPSTGWGVAGRRAPHRREISGLRLRPGYSARIGSWRPGDIRRLVCRQLCVSLCHLLSPRRFSARQTARSVATLPGPEKQIPGRALIRSASGWRGGSRGPGSRYVLTGYRRLYGTVNVQTRFYRPPSPHGPVGHVEEPGTVSHRRPVLAIAANPTSQYRACVDLR